MQAQLQERSASIKPFFQLPSTFLKGCIVFGDVTRTLQLYGTRLRTTLLNTLLIIGSNFVQKLQETLVRMAHHTLTQNLDALWTIVSNYRSSYEKSFSDGQSTFFPDHELISMAIHYLPSRFRFFKDIASARSCKTWADFTKEFTNWSDRHSSDQTPRSESFAGIFSSSSEFLQQLLLTTTKK
jgi:hypothetical protein